MSRGRNESVTMIAMKKTLSIGVGLLTLIIILLIGKWAMIGRDAVSVTPPTPLPESSLASYKNDRFGVSFSYPKAITPETEFKSFYHLSSDWRVGESDDVSGTPLVAIPLYRIDNGGVYKSYPMYYSAELRVGVSTSSVALAECLTGGKENNLELGEGPTTTVINGIEWKKVPVGSGGMMQFLYGNSYRLIRGDTCITVETLKTGSNYRDTPSPEDISDVDLESHYTALDTILATLHVDFTGVHCGGNIRTAPTCPNGYHCQLGTIPDVGGSCVAD